MRIALVGADFEENLGIGMIAAVAEAAGHEVDVVPFDYPEEVDRVAARVLQRAPEVVGLGIQFQHRALEFLTLARRLRARGFAGHLTCGGQYPTLAWREVLEHGFGVDSVVLHEGERAFVALLAALGAGAPLDGVAGLALRDASGAAMRTKAQPLLDALDELPFPVRYRGHASHCGIPFIPLMGSRGCWGACTYCSITSFYRDARAYGGGKTLRHRSPENVAAEMAVLSHDVGGPAIFCFHDDNFLLPRPSDSLARVQAMRDALDEFGVGKVGFIGKCRPDSVTPELMKALRALGVIRLYVGVENASQHGSDHLNRRTQTLRVRDALKACREAGIFVCYNLLLFEPDATLDDVRENVAFMREHAAHPVNFCRAEPYFGTPLHLQLASRQELGGSFLGFNYRIEDDRTELLFRVCASAFRQRNFDPAGVANRNMGLGYSMKVLEHFYEDPRGERAALAHRTAELTRAISTETAGFLEMAIEMVERLGTENEDAIARETALLGLRIAAADREKHVALDELYAEMDRYGARAEKPVARQAATPKLARVAQGLALSASLAMWGTACNSCGPAQQQQRQQTTTTLTPVDPVPNDNTVRNTQQQNFPPPDPVPPDYPVVNDPVPVDHPVVVDPPPPPIDTTRQQQQLQQQRQHRHRNQPPPPDPVPPPIGDPVPPPPVTDPLPPPHTELSPDVAPRAAVATSEAKRLQIVDQWRDTSTKLTARTSDLPLFDPPRAVLRVTRDGDALRVTITGVTDPMSFRWETAGEVVGEGPEITWRPDSSIDQLRVAVRTRGGVAVASVRAREV